MEEGFKRYKTGKTVVWWDLNTCPVPDGFDVRRVRPCIVSAANKYFGPRSVTIFAIGNLEIISPRLLKEISSAGILLSHAPSPFGTALLDVLLELKEHFPGAYLMLISGHKSWFSPSLLRFGFKALHVFPTSQPPAHHWNPLLEWETLLRTGPPSVVEINSQETDEPACFCRVCGIPSQSCDAFIEHLKSREHAHAYSPEHQCGTGILLMNSMNLGCSAEFASIIAATDITWSSTSTLNIMHHHAAKATFNKRLYPLPTTTVVLWDLNTCPVPPGYDIGCVRPSIESALKKLFGSLPVTVFAIGNLDLISPWVLKEIFSSGILLIHSPFDGGAREVADVLDEWRRRHPSWKEPNPSQGYNLLLISGNKSWCSHLLLCYGHTILRAFPNAKPAETYSSYKEWCWENLLEENSSPPLETNSQILEDKCTETGEDACFCMLCEIPSQSFDGFINHLKSKEHEEELWANVPVDTNDNPIFICKVCNYPADNHDNLTLHLKSEQHAQNCKHPC